MDTWTDIQRFDSSERCVSKFVFTKRDAVAEAVLYRYPSYAKRTVICCSTQSGCPVGCLFCGTGSKFVRSLTTNEIVEQVSYLLETVIDVTVPEIEKLQIMFMSMGEPMLNMKRTNEAIQVLNYLYPNADLLVSTSGPRVDYSSFIDLSCNITKVGLQFSIHESTDEARNKLIPFKAKLSLQEIADLGCYWSMLTSRRPFINYCVHEGNNSVEDVQRLVALFDPEIWEATVSVICEKDESIKASHERQHELVYMFMKDMLQHGFSTRMFNPAGQDDIGGGCGQLHYVQRWFKDNPEATKHVQRTPYLT